MSKRRVATIWTAIAAVLVLGLAGCQSTKTQTAEVTKTPPAPEKKAAKPAPGQKRTAATPSDLQPVYFDLDGSTLRPDARKALQANARMIQDNPSWGVVTIEGHCDERGSSEYNIALGQRRAMAVKSYLSDLGVPKSRFEVVSYGESKPAVAGHNESAWRYNRRAAMRTESQQLSQR
ncbi:MAG: peptidoglycan-associated lipoprotein Pal [Myxococcota bacterium]|nr:peptidoglycan-associated lipoprotein Pal [Myxococcota bacterium]